MIRVGVIGCGYWGPNLIRNLFELQEVTVAACCDLATERLVKVHKRYPTIRCTQSLDELLGDPALDAIVIATPVSTHYRIAVQALSQGKHVLVEKPLADSSERALDLMERAARAGKVLMVDHTFIYSAAVRKIRELVDAGEVGRIQYFDAVRINLGLFHNDVNVVWDLAAHDLSIMDFILARDPVAITAIGASHTGNHHANLAYLTVNFPDDLIAHLHVNWLAPVKVRMTLIGGSRKMVVYNDLEPSEKVRVYDKGVTVQGSTENRSQVLISYRVGDVLIPKLDITEPLQRVCEEFVAAILQHRSPLTNGEAGYRVVRLLEAAQASLDSGGRPVELRGALGSPAYLHAAAAAGRI